MHCVVVGVPCTEYHGVVALVNGFYLASVPFIHPAVCLSFYGVLSRWRYPIRLRVSYRPFSSFPFLTLTLLPPNYCRCHSYLFTTSIKNV